MRERRRFIRFKVPLDLELSVKGDDSFFFAGKSIDFSRQGIRLTIPFLPFSFDKILQFKTFMPEQDRPVFFKGNLRWSRKAEDMRELGVKIEKMEPEDKNDLLEYAYNLWKKQEYGV